MWSTVFVLFAALALVHGACNMNAKVYYEELGCKPEPSSDANCPASYDCSDLEKRKKDKCYYKGKEYNSGIELKEVEGSPCTVLCRCGASLGKTAFTCVQVECPELFNPPPPAPCYRSYKHGQCCSQKDVCETEAKEKVQKVVCQYDGVTYKEGQKFYPSEEPCKSCICQSGYNGTIAEPWCTKFDCNLELHYGQRISEGCVPIFWGEKGCCPIEWRCPKDTDSVASVESGTDSKTDSSHSEKTCKFGKLTLKVGEKLTAEEKEKERECTCSVPPHITCFEKRN